MIKYKNNGTWNYGVGTKDLGLEKSNGDIG